MAELIGLLASILQLVDTVVKAEVLLKDLHNANKDQARIFSEVQALQPLIAALQQRILANSSATGMQQIADPLRQFEDTMIHFSKKLKVADSSLGRMSKSLAWSLWSKEEAKEDLGKLERFKSLLNTWLTVDIWCDSPYSCHNILTLDQGHQSAPDQEE
jgi:hypothetical protein